MNPQEFQQRSKRTMPTNLSWHDRHQNCLLGLCGETGELIDMLKKTLFHDHKVERDKLISEMGDVCFYMTNLCDLYGVGFGAIVNADPPKDWKSGPDKLIRLHMATGDICRNLLLSEENGTRLDKAIEHTKHAFGYLASIARSYDIEIETVFDANVKKLEERYPDGFDPKRSRNRVA
jgi:NTP pyrophosphatase (non-canonical NTP hydrolase)